MAMQQPFTSGSHWRIPAPVGQPAQRVTTSARINIRAADHVWRIWSERWGERVSAVLSIALALVTLGGVSVAPLAALVALAALLLPDGGAMRALAEPFSVGAGVWLSLAILCAHALNTDSKESDHE